MYLEDFQANLRAIPQENRERFQQAAMKQLPVLVSLVDLCWDTIAELYWQFAVPADEDLSGTDQEPYWTPFLGRVLDHCSVVDELLLAMFNDVGVPARQVADADDTPSLFS